MDQELLDLIADNSGSEHDALLIVWERLKQTGRKARQFQRERDEAWEEISDMQEENRQMGVERDLLD